MKAARLLPRAAVSVAAVALVTGVIFGLKEVAPVLSLGVLYVFAVLPVAVSYGLGYAIAVSVGSMLAFNFFFLPPLHTLALRDSENWVALAVYLVTAVVVSELAATARRRSRAAVEAEALRRSDAAKTAVLHAVSHDLRSPLTAIRAATDGLQSGSLHLDEVDRAELLETIRLETARLERLVSNLLDLSRLEAGAARPQLELWPVDELVSRALEALGAEAARISVANAGETPPVRVDAAQLERLLVNVLENALRLSSPADAVEVSVRRRRRRDRDPCQRPRAWPGTGGSRPDLRALRAWERRPWDGPRPRDRPRVRGCERVPPLGGAEARIGCHLRPGDPGRARSRRGGSLSRARVLVVDDEPQILRALQTNLRGAGYEVETAATAEAALAAAAANPPDAVILDLVLPDGRGTDVCRELRTWSAAPVLLLSVVGDEHEKVAALDAGADDYVEKPFGIDELLARLRAALRRAGPSGEPLLEIGELVVDLENRSVDGGRTRCAADAARVRAVARARPERGEAPHASHAPARGLGPGLRRGVALPARLRLAAPPEDRAGPGAAAVRPDRAGGRLSAGQPARGAFLSRS